MNWYRSQYDTTPLRWHDLLPMRDMIDQRTVGIDAAYDLVFGDGPDGPVKTGYADFSNKRCWVNAEYFTGVGEANQIIGTTYFAAHERAHARWTDFHLEDFHLVGSDGIVMTKNGTPVIDTVLKDVWNLLEDERIERLVMRDFPHLHPYMTQGTGLFYKSVPHTKGDENPGDVLSYVLRRRLSRRSGVPLTDTLHPTNVALLAQCEPLLEEAFSCDSSRRVVEIAREIIKILGLESTITLVFGSLMSGQKGDRQLGDEADADGASEEEARPYSVSDAGRDLTDQLKKELEGLGFSKDVITGADVTPAAYEELLATVQPFTREIRQLFQTPPKKRVDQYEEAGARLSMRAYKRTPKTPFRLPSPPQRKSGVALTLIIDDSGSMAGDREHFAKLTAMLCLEALAGNNLVRAVLAPSGRVVADRSLKEMSRAMIAGYDSSNGTLYNQVFHREMTALTKLDRDYTKYLMLVADGDSDSSDQNSCKALVTQARRKGIHALGIGVELSTNQEEFFRAIFGEQFVGVGSANELPGRMQALLRRVARNHRHHGVA